MTDAMRKKLDETFATKTSTDAARNPYTICRLRDETYKIDIALVFISNWHGDTDDYGSVIIDGKGVVFTFPAYWISIPKELVMAYFEYIIDDFYENNVYKWFGESGAGTGGTGSGSGSCCPNPPIPPHPQYPGRPGCDCQVLNGN